MSKELNLPKDWFEKYLEDSEFKENLSKLGEFEYYDEDLEEPIIFKYWTDTRWKISEIKGEGDFVPPIAKYIISPAFWNDEEIEARFALRCAPNFHLQIYVKKDNKEHILSGIFCFKILADYGKDEGLIGYRKIELSPKDELIATIQNLDHFFTEKTPAYMSFDYNIVYLALKTIIDHGLASNKLLEYRRDEIKDIILKIIEDSKEIHGINQQIYIQLKALFDFEPDEWVKSLIGKLDLLQYLKKMYEIEEENTKRRAANSIEKIEDTRAIKPLFNIWKDKESELRWSAAVALGKMNDSRVLKSLTEELRNIDSNIRWRAIIALGEIGYKKALEPLIEILNNKTDKYRRFAAMALGKFRDKRVIEPLIQALDDQDIQYEVIVGLTNLGKLALDSLISALKNEKKIVKQGAIRALGKIKASEAVDPLIQTLKDEDSHIRRLVLEALREIKDKKALDIIIATLNDSDGYVRHEATKVLREMPDEIAIPSLMQALNDKESLVRSQAKYALVKIGEPAVEPLINAINDASIMDRDEIVEALGDLKDKRAVEPLIKAFNHESKFFRNTIISALGKIGDIRAQETLLKALRDEYDRCRSSAAYALYRMNLEPKKDIDKVYYYFTRNEREKLVALGEVAIEPLLQLLNDENNDVKKHAEEVLKEMGWKPKNDIEKAYELIATQNWRELRELGEPAIIPLFQNKDYKISENVWDTLKRIAKSHVEPFIEIIKDKKNEYREKAIGVLGASKSNEAVKYLLPDLDDENFVVRKDAIRALGSIGDIEAVEPIIQALDDKIETVRTQAIIALGNLQDKRAIEPLIKFVESQSHYERKYALEALNKLGWKPESVSEKVKRLFNQKKWFNQKNWDEIIKFGESAIEPLIEIMTTVWSWVDQQDAIRCLGKIGSKKAVEPLVNFIEDKKKEKYARHEAIRALGLINDETTVDLLISIMNDDEEDDYYTRSAAIWALGEIGIPKPVSGLIKLTKNENKYIKRNVLRTLGKIGDKRAVPYLIDALEDFEDKRDDRNYNKEYYDEYMYEKLRQWNSQDQNWDDTMGDWTVRHLAAWALGKIGAIQALDKLIELLNDEDEDIRIISAWALGRIGNAKAVKPLKKALDDEFSFVRKKAMDALTEIGEFEDIDTIIKKLKDKNKSARMAAVGALGKIGSSRAAEVLIQALKDEFEFLREEYTYQYEDMGKKIEEFEESSYDEHIWHYTDKILSPISNALGKIGKPAVEPLIKALKGENDNAQWGIVDALGIIGDPSAIEPLINSFIEGWEWIEDITIEALAKFGDKAVDPLIKALKNQNSNIRAGVARVLGMIGNEKAVDSLLQVLEDENRGVREAAVRALGKIGDEKIVKPLLKALRDDYEVSWNAAEALSLLGKKSIDLLIQELKTQNNRVKEKIIFVLGKIKDPRVVDILIELLNDKNKDIRNQAARALGAIGNKRATEPLIEALKNEDKKFRDEIIFALGELKDKRAIEPLIKILQEKNSWIREKAEAALKKIGGKKIVKLNIEVLKNKDEDIKKSAMNVLSSIGKFDIDSLLVALKNENSDLRIGAANALGNILRKKVLDNDDYIKRALISTLRDPDYKVRKAVASALFNNYHFGMGQEDIYAQFLVAQTSFQSLERYGESAIDALVPILSDKEFWLRERAAETLDKLNWNPRKDQDKVNYYIAKKQWNKLINLGKTAINTLVEILIYGPPFLRSEVVKILQKLDWNPKNDLENAWYLIVERDWQNLENLGEKALGPLLDALKYEDRKISRKIIELISKIGDKAVEPLINMLQFEKRDVKNKVARVLGKIGNTKAVTPLLEFVKDDRGIIEGDVVWALGEIGDNSTINLLKQLLGESDKITRILINEALQKFGESPLNSYTLSLKNEDPAVRVDTISQLVGIGTSEAIELVVNTMLDEKKIVRETASKALDGIGWAPKNDLEKAYYNIAKENWYKLINMGVKAVRPLLHFLKNKNEKFRGEIEANLIEIGNKTSYPFVQALNDKDKFIQAEAARILGIIGDTKSVEPLIALLNNEDKYILWYTIETLGNLGDPKAVEPLIKILNSKIPGVNFRSAASLGKIGDIRAMEPLIQALKDAEEYAKKYFYEALNKLGKLNLNYFIQALNDDNKDIRLNSVSILGNSKSETVVEPLIKLLNDKDSDIRASAIGALGEIGNKKAIEPIRNMLNDENYRVIREAMRVLGDFKDAKSVDAIINIMEDKYKYVKFNTELALSKIGEPAVDPLIKNLKNKNTRIREASAIALGYIKDEKALEPLIEALKDEDANVKWRAREALKALGDERAVIPLIQIFKEEKNSHSASGIVKLIGNFKTEESFEFLIKCLKGEYGDFEFPAIEALSLLGDSRAVMDLISKLNHSKYWVRREVVKLLGKIGDKRVVQILIDKIKNEHYEVRSAIVDALASIGKPAVEPLIQELTDSDYRVRLRTISILGRIGDKSAIEPIVQCLKDDELSVRREAIIALGKIGDKRTIEIIVQQLKDKEKRIKESAVEALGEIGDLTALNPLNEMLKIEKDYTIRKALREAIKKIKNNKKVDSEPGNTNI